jgi:hypothetical protein
MESNSNTNLSKSILNNEQLSNFLKMGQKMSLSTIRHLDLDANPLPSSKKAQDHQIPQLLSLSLSLIILSKLYVSTSLSLY